MFDSLTQKFEGIFARLRGKGRLSSGEIDVALSEVRVALLDADVNLGVVDAFLERIRLRTLGEELKRSLTPGQQVVKIVHEELVKTLGSAAVPLKQGAPPSKILMVGLQGSGKTTTAAKLAVHLRTSGKRPLLVAADLQRPAAIDQLETLGQKAGVPVYADRAGRPARLVKAAIKEAIRLGNDVVVIDTAGRLQIDRDLMRELADVSKEAVPDEVLLVVDATTGQEAVNVARGFLEHVPLTGVVLSKLDGDARGGAAISVREVTGCPIKFAGTGESITALETFHPERMATRILGMGDVLSLIEKAEQTFDEDEAEKAAAKMMKGQFSLEDFLDQMQALKRMGPLKDLIAMLPGAGQLRDVRIDDRDVGRVEAIVRSMTPEERRNPKVIGGSRKRRIASGSGTSPQDVNRLLKQFADAQRMMKMLSSGRGLPGMAHGRRMKR